ncbi:tubulin polyglutamylase TTLL11-like isoform X2 [Tubulanus polymorphus]|uniref:tubulin polyglutamylase TTLL11-like isoform X2 n=1 Tax=Tubulanus polymorphus TaxID=672921 RepID=UPI003DA677C1
MNYEPPGRRSENDQPLSKAPTFRYQMHTMERRQVARQERASRTAVRQKYTATLPKSNNNNNSNNRPNVSVDSSKAKSNRDVLRLTLKELGWREYPYGRKDGNCDVYWLGCNFIEHPDILTGYVNKFPGMIYVLRKGNMARSLDNMRHVFPEEFNYYPKTWFLPHQYNEFAEDVRAARERRPKRKQTYIVKPNDGAQGDGIYLIKGPEDLRFNTVMPNRTQVVQDYITRPFLIDGYKFDLRIYCLLTNLNPLEIYISKEGLARFCTSKYEEPTNENLADTFMHLTNYSLNKRSSNYVHTDTQHEGSKRTSSSVFEDMARAGHNIEKLWRDIEKVIVKTIIALVPELKVELNAEVPTARKMKPKCFQILGFDILLTEDLRPMLLEVNANPSLRIDYQQESSSGAPEYLPSIVDEEVKRPLIRDTLLLIAPKPYRRKPRRRRRKRTQRVTTSESVIDDTQEYDENKENEDSVNNNIHVDYEHDSSLDDNLDSAADDSNIDNVDSSDAADQAEEIDVSCNDNDKVEAGDKLAPPPPPLAIERHREQTGTAEIFIHGQNSNLNNRTNADKPATRNQTSAALTNNSARRSGVGQPAEMRLNRQRTMVYNHEPDNTTNSSDWEDDDDILEQIYPVKYAARYEHLKLFDRVTSIFQNCLGVKGSMRMGSSGFRTFTRKCQLVSGNLTNADMDLIFLEMQRKWEHMNPERTSGGNHRHSLPTYCIQKPGLSFQGFIDAFIMIAKRKFYSRDKVEMLENLVEYCEAAMEGNIVEPGRLPSITKEQARLEEIRRIYVAQPARLAADESTENTDVVEVDDKTKNKKSGICSIL